MKYAMTNICFLLIFTLCKGQTKTTPEAKSVKEQIEIMGQHFIQKDFDSFSNYIYPKVIEMVGGKQKMVEIMEKGVKEMLAEGKDFLSVSFGEPSKIVANRNELQCTIPQTLEMKVPNGRLIAKSTIIAISTDNGNNWRFVDTSGKDLKTMQNLLPNLSGELFIPEKTQPVFYPE